MWTYAGSRVQMYFIYQCAQNNTFPILNHRHNGSLYIYIANSNGGNGCSLSLILPLPVDGRVSPNEEHFNNYYFANFSSIFFAYKLLFLASVQLHSTLLLYGVCISVCFASFFGLQQLHSIDSMFSLLFCRCSLFRAATHNATEDVRCRKSEIVNYLLTRELHVSSDWGRKRYYELLYSNNRIQLMIIMQ